MKEKLLKEMREKIEVEIVEVEDDLKSIGRINPKNPKDWEALPGNLDVMPSDQNEVADSIESYEENTAILKQLEIRLNELKTAIDRINKGNYGICEIGKEKIEEDRLFANPAATTCKKHM